MTTQITWDLVRNELIGKDAEIVTPYGSRRVTYADYTASGRGVNFIEQSIKRHLNAQNRYKLIAVGAGATAAINRLQEILGIYVPPATWERIGILSSRVAGVGDGLLNTLRRHGPVVFVGP